MLHVNLVLHWRVAAYFQGIRVVSDLKMNEITTMMIRDTHNNGQDKHNNYPYMYNNNNMLTIISNVITITEVVQWAERYYWIIKLTK